NQDVRAECGITLEHLVVRPLQSIAAIIADAQSDHQFDDGALNEDRQAPEWDVGQWTAEERFRHVPISGLQADITRLAETARVAGHVDAGISSADDEHALALELRWFAVILRMQHVAGERAAKLGIALVPMVAVTNDDAFVNSLFAVGELYDPAAGIMGRGEPNSLLEFAMPEKVTILRKALEISEHLIGRRKIRVIGRHRIV